MIQRLLRFSCVSANSSLASNPLVLNSDANATPRAHREKIVSFALRRLPPHFEMRRRLQGKDNRVGSKRWGVALRVGIQADEIFFQIAYSPFRDKVINYDLIPTALNSDLCPFSRSDFLEAMTSGVAIRVFQASQYFDDCLGRCPIRSDGNRRADLPDVLRRIQLGRVGRKWQEDDVVGHNELRRAVPARTVEDQ